MLHMRPFAEIRRRRGGRAAVDRPVLFEQVKSAAGGEHVHVRIPERIECADVLPVTGKAVGGHLFAVLQHFGNDVLTKVIAARLVALVLDEVGAQLFPRENINAHRSKVALRLCGLFFKFRDRVRPVHIHDAEARCIFPRYLHHGDGAIRPCLFVLVEHLGIVHLVNMVAREDKHILGVVHIDKADVLEDGVGRALVPRSAVRALIRRQDMYAAVCAVKIPWLAGADVAVELQRAVLRQYAHGVNARVGAVRERKINDAELAAERYGGLRHIFREHIEPAALPAGKQHGDTFFLHACSLLLVSLPSGHTSGGSLVGSFSFCHSPSPAKNTAPSGGMVTHSEQGLPCEGMDSVKSSPSLRQSPVPPYAGRSVVNTSRYIFFGGTPKR